MKTRRGYKLSKAEYKAAVRLGSLPNIKYPKGQNPFLIGQKLGRKK